MTKELTQQKQRTEDGCLLFIFGATGDLARRKLFPAIYSMYREKKLNEKFAVIGMARRERTDETFREDVYQSIMEYGRYKPELDSDWENFLKHFYYKSMDINDTNSFIELDASARKLEQQYEIACNRLFYLALAPELFGKVAHHLHDGGLLDCSGWHRLVIEKPFGYDLPSAEKLNTELREVFDESEIYRIDHYLGKEMVQNMEVIRFANVFFEPLWNNKYISNIQITASETVGVEDRGGYYDQAGALRDMGQNHIMQMVAMMAMEPPSRQLAEDIRDEKVKVFKSLRAYDRPEDVKNNVIRGQYVAGQMNGQSIRGYRDEDHIPEDSQTETYVAAKLYVDNFRWAGVPFYVRTGKRLPAKVTEVVVEFKNMPDHVHFSKNHDLSPNLLVIRVNPKEGVYIKFNAKDPEGQAGIVPVAMDFTHDSSVGMNTPEAYERLLYDAIRGDSTYFTRWDEVKLSWSFVDHIFRAWEENAGELHKYPAGSWGPDATERLLAKEGHHWWPLYGQPTDHIPNAKPQTKER